jgi:hypothetical protein
LQGPSFEHIQASLVAPYPETSAAFCLSFYRLGNFSNGLTRYEWAYVAAHPRDLLDQG